VLGGAATAGILGFILTFVVARVIGAAHVAGFSAVWSGTYLVSGALVGIQQEVARAARPPEGRTRTPLTRLAAGTAALTLVIAAAIATVWVFPVFGQEGWQLILPLAVGPAGYVVVAFVVGSLYGLHAWGDIALLVVTDAVLRLAAVGGVLLLTHDIRAIAWAIAIPFGLTLVLLAPRVRHRLRDGVRFDVAGSRLLLNAAKTVAASLSTAVMISGFSLLVVASSPGEPAALVGAVAFAVTVVRAPIMIGMMAAQSLLVVRLRDAQRPARSAASLLLLVLGVGALLALLAVTIGDPVLAAIVGPQYAIGGGLLALVVASSALVGLLFVSGPLALALGRHSIYALGWALSAVLTVGLLLLPVEFELRLAFALLIPPVVGFGVHVLGLWATRHRPHPSAAPTPAF
jgi:O-antigen/teichoic acid export membrane protein